MYVSCIIIKAYVSCTIVTVYIGCIIVTVYVSCIIVTFYVSCVIVTFCINCIIVTDYVNCIIMFLLTRWPCISNLWVHCTRFKTRVKVYCDFYINPMYCRITWLNLDCKEKCSHTTDVLFDLVQRSDLKMSVLICACFFHCFLINKLMIKGNFLSLKINFDYYTCWTLIVQYRRYAL